MSPLSLFALMVEEQATVARPFAAQLFQTGTLNGPAVQARMKDGMTVMQQAFGVAMADALAGEAFDALAGGKLLADIGPTLAQGLVNLTDSAMAYSLDAFKARVVAHGDDPALAQLCHPASFNDGSKGWVMTIDAKRILARSMKPVLELFDMERLSPLVSSSLSDSDKRAPEHGDYPSTALYHRAIQRFSQTLTDGAPTAGHEEAPVTTAPASVAPVIPSLNQMTERWRPPTDLEALYGKRPTNEAFLKADEALQLIATASSRTSSDLSNLGQQFVVQVNEHGISPANAVHLLDHMLRSVVFNPTSVNKGVAMSTNEKTAFVRGFGTGLQAIGGPRDESWGSLHHLVINHLSRGDEVYLNDHKHRPRGRSF